MASSAPLRSEVQANPTASERRFFQVLFQQYGVWLIIAKEDARKRILELGAIGVSEMDALHVAIAEATEHNFISCDDRLLRQLARSDVRIWYGTPVAFCAREDLT